VAPQSSLDRIDAGHGFGQCFHDMPEWSDFGYVWDWWSNTNTVYLPARGLVVGQWHGMDSGGDYVTYHVENDTGSLTFRAPTKYGSNTTVVLTFENLSYDAYGMGMDWRQIKLKWNGTTHDPVEPGGYLVTVDGGKKYTVDESTFEWPTITTNIVYDTHIQTVIIHRLSFSGFHNRKPTNKCKIAIFVGHGKVLPGHPNPPREFGDIDPNSDIGTFAQQKADDDYLGVGIMGCWVVATINQVDQLRTTQHRNPINWVNKYSGGDASFTYRKYTYAIGEDLNLEGPGEPDGYSRKTRAEIRDALKKAADNMAQDACNTCRTVSIEVSGEDIDLKSWTHKCGGTQ
jgi:hypothetical protein